MARPAAAMSATNKVAMCTRSRNGRCPACPVSEACAGSGGAGGSGSWADVSGGLRTAPGGLRWRVRGRPARGQPGRPRLTAEQRTVRRGVVSGRCVDSPPRVHEPGPILARSAGGPRTWLLDASLPPPGSRSRPADIPWLRTAGRATLGPFARTVGGAPAKIDPTTEVRGPQRRHRQQGGIHAQVRERTRRPRDLDRRRDGGAGAGNDQDRPDPALLRASSPTRPPRWTTASSSI